MRCIYRHFPMGLAIVLVLLSLGASPVSAEEAPPEETCPEGLVYDAAGDICVLPENLPENQEEGDEGLVEDPAADEEDAAADEEDPAADEPADDEAAQAEEGREAGSGDQIRNLTLITYSCPINWNPATRAIEDSREMCTEPIVPAMTYTILFEGTEMTTAGLGTDVDLAVDPGLNGVPLPAGMWTIRENMQEGLADPFAYCAIYAADGTSRLTVMETVPGGSLDILLAAGEEVNCEWYSVAEAPEVTGDPNALPIGGLRLDGFSCPFGTDPSASLEHLVATCVEKGIAPVTYTATLDGTLVSTQVGATDTPGVDFQTGLDSRLLSGTWTLAATLPAGYEQSLFFCSITTEAGVTTDLAPETTLGYVTLALQPGDTGFCRWFNVESEPRSGPSLGIQLLLHTCPEGFDRVNGDYQACTLPLQEPVTFDFIHNGQVVETGTASPPDMHYAVKANGGRPEAGEWTIRPNFGPDRIEPGWACWGVDATGAKVLGVDYFAPTDGGVGISARFGPNLMLQCDVWIYADDLSQTVRAVVRFCPDGFDAANPAAGDKYTTCTKSRFVGVTFTLDDGTPVQTETASGGLAFVPAEPGQWRISVDPGEGRAVTFVSCDHTIAALGQVQTIEPTINADGRSVTFDLDEGDVLRCDFFTGVAVAGAQQPADVGDAGTEAGDAAMEQSDAADAPGTGEGVGDAPANPGDTGQEAPDAADTGEGNGTTQPGTGGDAFGGGGDAPDSDTGTGETTTDPDAGATAPEDADDGSTTEVSAGGGASELSIQHYDCDSPVADPTVDDLVESCTASVGPSSWVMNGEPLTVSDGYAVWNGLEPDTVRVGNLAASGMEDAASAVYCSVAPAGSDPLVGLQVPVRNGVIEIIFDQPAVVSCAWFVGP